MKPEQRRLPTVTQVKAVSPEMNTSQWANGLSPMKPAVSRARKGECVMSCRDCKPQWAINMFVSELGRTNAFPISRQRVSKEARRW